MLQLKQKCFVRFCVFGEQMLSSGGVKLSCPARWRMTQFPSRLNDKNKQFWILTGTRSVHSLQQGFFLRDGKTFRENKFEFMQCARCWAVRFFSHKSQTIKNQNQILSHHLTWHLQSFCLSDFSSLITYVHMHKDQTDFACWKRNVKQTALQWDVYICNTSLTICQNRFPTLFYCRCLFWEDVLLIIEVRKSQARIKLR